MEREKNKGRHIGLLEPDGRLFSCFERKFDGNAKEIFDKIGNGKESGKKEDEICCISRMQESMTW